MQNARSSRFILLPLAALAMLNLLPLAYMLWMGAWEGTGDDGSGTLFGPWRRLWASAPAFGHWMLNSFTVALVSVGFHLIADAIAGFVLAKRPFRGRSAVFILIILAMMVPRQVTLIPLFLGMARVGLADTMAGLILPGLGDVIGIFLMRQFFLTLPDSLLEAARIDGASEWQIFRLIALPLARPALAVLGILGFQHYWGDFFWPLVITQDSAHFTVQVGLAYMTQSEFGPDLPLMAAGASAAALPILLIFILARRHFFEGMRAGAVKG